jgi:hypothetical protein
MDIVNWPVNFLSEYISSLWQILIIWAMMIALLRAGKFGVIFRVYNTFFHELGHGIMSLATSGNIHKIELFSNAGGVAVTSNKAWISKLLVSIAGYPLATVVGWLMLTQMNTFNQLYLAYGILGIYCMSLILWVRNKYGIVWLLCNILLVGSAIYFEQHQWAKVYFFIVGSFILFESIWSCLVILYISAENPKEAGDAKNLRDLTYIPAVFWAIIFCGSTLFFLNLTLAHVIVWRIFEW